MRSRGSERWPGRCAYCGEPGADEVEHVIPSCLYPPGWAPGEYLTVPSHARCNRVFSAAEVSFKEDLATAGSNDAAAATRETLLRGFRRPRTHHRGQQLLDRLHEGRIFPIRNPETVRVLRKVVRGLAFYHGLFIALPEELITVSPTKFEIPAAFIPDARIREVRHAEIFECLGFLIEDLPDPAEPDDVHSFWRLRFYDRVRFDAWIERSRDARGGHTA